MTACPATVNIVTPLTLEKTAKSSCENIRPTLTTTVTLIAAHVVSQTTMILSRLDWPPMNLPQTRCRCSLQASQHSWHKSQAAAQESKVYHKLFSHDNDFLVAQTISLNIDMIALFQRLQLGHLSMQKSGQRWSAFYQDA